jgi:hypothetical protein
MLELFVPLKAFLLLSFVFLLCFPCVFRNKKHKNVAAPVDAIVETKPRVNF